METKIKRIFLKVTLALYFGARQRTENRLSRVFITQYPLINIIRFPNASLHVEFKHLPPPTPPHSCPELATLTELQVKLKSLWKFSLL